MIVVFGGAFNPPTIAHREIYDFINRHLDVEHFIYLPVSKKYTKNHLVDDAHRIQMLTILTRSLDKAKVSKVETEEAEFKGTYHSLLHIKKSYPNREVAFVLGADNLLHLDHWINAENLLKDFRFIVVNRNHTNVNKIIEKKSLLKHYKDHFIVLEAFESNVSSTLFRDTLDPYYVDEDIYHYIMKNDLYRGNQ
ncbi:MAG TPA: nicotinate (nicotinamide) nucleotide adenylyltransferase [Candidatus Izemoplasmatales bacterium]|nr:nicotinate (nicotinamide) nucleotide adenylyltransferase [Candidatus Izemoplasmatales bacterium]